MNFNSLKEIISYNQIKMSSQDALYLRIGFLTLSFLAMIFTIINFLHRDIGMMVSTFILSLAFLTACLAGKKRITSKKYMVFLSSIMCVTATIYLVIGGNDGFAALWILVVPIGTMTFISFEIGLYSFFYLFFAQIIFFWTELYKLCPYEYGEEMRIRFPFLSIAIFVIAAYNQYYINKARIKEENDNIILETKLAEERLRVQEMYNNTIKSICEAIEAKDSYTHCHSQCVALVSQEIAKELGWKKEDLKELEDAAMLHDIGKIGIRDSILLKKSSLSDDEYEEIKSHTIKGWKILKNLTQYKNIALAALMHHERYDGKGYPKGLRGDELPETIKIISIADSIDAMNSNRSYRGKMLKNEIVNELKKGKGKQFDPILTDIAIRLIQNKDLLEITYGAIEQKIDSEPI